MHFLLTIVIIIIIIVSTITATTANTTTTTDSAAQLTNKQNKETFPVPFGEPFSSEAKAARGKGRRERIRPSLSLSPNFSSLI